jgi:hypothetical protein
LHPVSVARYETGAIQPKGPARAFLQLWIEAALAGRGGPRVA